MTTDQMNWLVDTNIISETKKIKKSLQVAEWLASVPIEQLYTSTVNIAELACGVARLENIQSRRELDTWLAGIVRPWFKDRILEVDENALIRWRILTRAADQNGKPSPAMDLLIAAVAFENNMGIATRDTAPFVAAGVPTLNPLTGERFNGA